jgi:hypothetical protein
MNLMPYQVLFAVTTHLELEQYPILVYLGVAGSGKSSAMKQLFAMCKGAKWIQGKTESTHTQALAGCRTAFIDEGDIIDSVAGLTDLYTKRFLAQSATVEVNVKGKGGKWTPTPFNVLGATVMAKRAPLADFALRSRSIIVRTEYELGNYDLTNVGDVSAIAVKVEPSVKKILKEMGNVDRVYQTWSALDAMADVLGMGEWRKQERNVQAEEAETLKGGQGFEPSEAALRAMDILARNDLTSKREDKSVKLSDVVRVAKDEFAVILKQTQVSDLAKAKKFEVGTLKGYPVVKVKKELLDKLLPDAG